MTRAPSASSRPGRSATSRLQVTGTDRSAAGSRRVRNTVAAPRRDSWATCPSTQTSPSRPIHSATLRATVRTGQGASGVEGAVMPRGCQTGSAPSARTPDGDRPGICETPTAGVFLLSQRPVGAATALLPASPGAPGSVVRERTGAVLVIPISVVDVRDAEPLVLEVIRSGVLAQGPMVQRLEDAFADVVGVRHAVAVNNGTTALVAALQVQDLEPGDEVVTSPFTFAATVNAVLEAGATVRFADIREEDFAVDPALVAARVGERTRVLLPVHLYGQTADMGPITELARERGLHVVEDAAQAHGAAYEGRAAGSFGTGCFSFYATKNRTTGEGGMVTTDEDGVGDRLEPLRKQGTAAGHRYWAP